MARKSVLGTVTGFSSDKVECYLALKDQDKEVGEGVFDTTKLVGILLGISDIESFLGVGTTVSALVHPKEQGAGDTEQDEQQDEEDTTPKKFEVIRVRPLLGGIRTNRFPKEFSRGISYDRRRYTIPGFGFSKQAIPSGESSEAAKEGAVEEGAAAEEEEAAEGAVEEEAAEEKAAEEKKPATTVVPGELVAEVICELRKQVSKWNGFPIHELLNVLSKRDEFAHIQKHFTSQDDLIEFLKAFPQYFVVSEDDYAVYTMRGFKTEDLHDYLATQKLRRKQRRKDEAYELVETVDDCKEVVAELREKASEQTPLVLALGCKGVKLRSGGPMTLLKVSTMEGVAYIFDLLATDDKKDMFDAGGLKEILEDEGIIKVTYDCRTEQKALYNQFDVVLRNVFDVSIAYTVISEQCHVTSRSAPKFRPARPKFSELCSIFGVRKPRNQRAFMETMNSTKDFWATRPLTDEMLDFAIDDVLCLVPVIYRDLDRFISPLWWPLYETRVEETLQRSKKLDDTLEDGEEGDETREEEREEEQHEVEQEVEASA